MVSCLGNSATGIANISFWNEHPDCIYDESRLPVQQQINLPVECKIADFFLHFCYAFDLIVHSRKTFYNKEGDETFSQKAVCRRQLSSFWFYFDLVTLLPLPQLFWNTKIHLFLRLLLIFRMHKLLEWSKTLNCGLRVKNIVKVFTCIILLLALIFTFAALWILVLSYECDWHPLYQQLPGAKNPFCEGPSRVTQFLLSIVYTNIMIISEGEAFPCSEMQLVIAAGFLLIGSFIDAILFGVVVNSVQEANAKEIKLNEEFNQTIQTVRSLGFDNTKFRNLRHTLYGRTVASLQHQEFQNFLNHLSPSLRQRVVNDLFHEKFTNCIFLRNQDNSENVPSNISLSLHYPEEVIFQYGSQSNGIYFLLKGQVDLYLPILERDNGLVLIKSLKPGEYFGQIGSFLQTTRSLRAQSYHGYSTLAFLPTECVNGSIREDSQKKKSVLKSIQQYNDLFCGWVGRVLHTAHLLNDQMSQIQLYKFRIKEYSQNQFIWKAGEKPEGLMVVLSGFITFQIKTAGVMVPMGSARQKSIIGFDHSFTGHPHQCYAHAETKVRVAFYPYEELQSKIKIIIELLSKGAKEESWAMIERKRIRASKLRPYPIDLRIEGKSRKRKATFVFQNCVINIIRALRRDRHEGFLNKLKRNIKSQEQIERRLKKHRQFIRQSLKHQKCVQLGGRNKIRASLMDCTDFLENQYFLRKKLDKVFNIVSGRSRNIRAVELTLRSSIVSMAADNYLEPMNSCSSSQLSYTSEEKELVKELENVASRKVLRLPTTNSTINLSVEIASCQSFVSERVEGIYSTCKLPSFHQTPPNQAKKKFRSHKKVKRVGTPGLSHFGESFLNF